MHSEMTDEYDPLADDDDLAPLLDVMFILLIALMVVLTFFAQQEFEHRFAVPSGPGSALVAVGEQDYRRMVVVSLDRDGRLGVNGQEVANDALLEQVAAALDKARATDDSAAPPPPSADRNSPPVVFDADPTVPHGDAERVYLRLLRYGFQVLKEYQETDDEHATDRV